MEREMTDIHMHLIPGVDDGAADLNMAQVMLIRAREQGIRCIFATPHSSAFDYYGPDTVAARFRQLQAVAARYFPEIALFPGCEVFCEKDRMPEIVGALRGAV